MPPQTRTNGRNAVPHDPEPLDPQQAGQSTMESRETVPGVIPENPQETPATEVALQNIPVQRSAGAEIDPEDLPDEALDTALQDLMREETRLLKIQQWHELRRRTDAQRARLGRPQEQMNQYQPATAPHLLTTILLQLDMSPRLRRMETYQFDTMLQ